MTPMLLEQEITIVINDGPPIWAKAAFLTLSGAVVIRIPENDPRNEPQGERIPDALRNATIHVRPEVVHESPPVTSHESRI